MVVVPGTVPAMNLVDEPINMLRLPYCEDVCQLYSSEGIRLLC